MKTAIQRGTANRSGHDPRTAALRILDQVFTGNDPSQLLLDKTLTETKLVPSDKSLCTELVYGYLRNRIRLTWNLEQLLRNPDGLPGEMLLALGLASYEIAHLRIPPHASVNWAVTRIRNRFGKGLAGVANGVLRSFVRSMKGYADETRYIDALGREEGLAILYSIPGWVAKLWLDEYGEERARAYMKASSCPAFPAIRINAAVEDAVTVRIDLMTKGQRENKASLPIGPWGIAFPSGLPFAARKLEREGRLSFQAAAVQELLQETEMPSWPSPVWDACAGRGGKTAAMLERGLSVSVSSDIATARIQALPDELTRLGFAENKHPVVLEADAANVSDHPVFATKFATVLLDVPCSGLGTLARRPEIRYRRIEADIAGFVATQDSLLDSAARHVRDDGQIVYVTCTLNPAENEERILAFLNRVSCFVLEKEWTTASDSSWNEFLYAAVLRKKCQ